MGLVTCSSGWYASSTMGLVTCFSSWYASSTMGLVRDIHCSLTLSDELVLYFLLLG